MVALRQAVIRAGLAFAGAAIAALCSNSIAVAEPSVEQFYKGRTITLHVPTSPGGINDIAGRLVARHLGAFIPGSPGFVVQNSPGGNGLVAANKLFNTAARDGSVISIIGRATPQAVIQGDPNAKFDPLEMTWLGSLSSYKSDAYLIVINASNPVQSAADLRKPGVSVTLGGEVTTSTNLIFANIARVVLGLNIEVVRGYPGAAPMFLAMQRHEIDGQVIGYSSIRAGQPQLWSGKLLRPLVQYGHDVRLAEFPDVPTGQELAPDAAAKALVQYAELPFHMALPFLTPPGLPPERAKALQEAFMKMTREQAFLEDAAKLNLDISPIDGDAVRDIIVRSAQTPKEVIAHYNEIVSTRSSTR
jgi:tripartite-type tricarboxylate transporter receptor subunit TctC